MKSLFQRKFLGNENIGLLLLRRSSNSVKTVSHDSQGQARVLQRPEANGRGVCRLVVLTGRSWPAWRSGCLGLGGSQGPDLGPAVPRWGCWKTLLAGPRTGSPPMARAVAVSGGRCCLRRPRWRQSHGTTHETVSCHLALVLERKAQKGPSLSHTVTKRKSRGPSWCCFPRGLSGMWGPGP